MEIFFQTLSEVYYTLIIGIAIKIPLVLKLFDMELVKEGLDGL